MTFIITNKDGSRTQYSNHYNEDNEIEVDAAWDDVMQNSLKLIILSNFNYG